MNSLTNLICRNAKILCKNDIQSPIFTQICYFNYRRIKELQTHPKDVYCLKNRVFLPKDGYYTTKPLNQLKLGGRDPVTKHIVHGAVGGGLKHKFLWTDYYREGPTTKGEFLYEKVLDIIIDPNQYARLAFVNTGEHLRYIIATTSMKPGQIIKTSSYIPRIPVQPEEGDAYPVGALPIGTKVCLVSQYPGGPAHFAINAGMTALLKSKVDNKYILQMPDKRLFLLEPECMCTVGQVSNPQHKDIPIGSPNQLRLLGWRPRSGLWQRKDGYCGRKIKPTKPPRPFSPEKPPVPRVVVNLYTEQSHKKIIQCVRRKT